MRLTESRAPFNAPARRVLSAAHAATDSIVPMTGHTRDTGGGGSAPQAATHRPSASVKTMGCVRLILKNDS